MPSAERGGRAPTRGPGDDAADSGDGPVALVTGSGSGIGERIVHALADRGYRVVVNDVDPDRARTVAGTLGATAMAVAADVSDPAAVERMVATVVERTGRIDLLVNNAGIADSYVATAEQDVDAWQTVIDVNLRGVYLCCRQVGGAMVGRGSGSIVNVASVLGLRGLARRTGYGPSKAAVINLTQTLAAEWAPHGVRVNAVAPGHVRTPLLESLADAGRVDLEALERRIPMGRLADPSEVADAVAFLASPQASYVNGTTLVVDGACTATLGLEEDPDGR